MVAGTSSLLRTGKERRTTWTLNLERLMRPRIFDMSRGTDLTESASFGQIDCNTLPKTTATTLRTWLTHRDQF